MKPCLSLLLILLISVGLSACNSPPLYEKHAREYLLAKGEKPELVQQLQRLQTIDAQTLNKLAAYNNIAVLHLVASNPGAPEKLLKALAGHSNVARCWPDQSGNNPGFRYAPSRLRVLEPGHARLNRAGCRLATFEFSRLCSTWRLLGNLGLRWSA